MADLRPALAAFETDTFDQVAAETPLDAEQLRDLTRRHQESVRELPGVDDIVYEWRNYFHMDPLVHRSERAYVLAVQGHVWEEFAEGLELSEEELTAIKTVHEVQARTVIPETDRFDTDDAVVLTRP